MTGVPSGATPSPSHRRRVVVAGLVDLAREMGPLTSDDEAEVMWTLLHEAGLLVVDEQGAVVEEMTIEEWQTWCVRACLRSSRRR
jgi:hypothetical protein